MVKHVLMYRLKDRAAGRSKEENAELCTRTVLALADQIRAIQRVEVGRNFAKVANAYDLVVTVELDRREDLTTLIQHPAHHAAGELIAPLRDDWIVVDYEVAGA